jgi:hypothetical protein
MFASEARAFTRTSRKQGFMTFPSGSRIGVFGGGRDRGRRGVVAEVASTVIKNVVLKVLIKVKNKQKQRKNENLTFCFVAVQRRRDIQHRDASESGSAVFQGTPVW